MTTVWDALSWVAFGEFRRQPDLSDLMETVDRWTDDRLAAILAALEARASPEPFCVVERVIDNELYPNEALYAHRAWSPKGPAILRRIRAKARAREGRLVTYSELAATLRSELEAMTSETARLKDAEHELLEKLRAGQITAWGLGDVRGQRSPPVTSTEPIPIDVFMSEYVTLTIWDSVGPNPEHPTAIQKYAGPRYKEVRFWRAEVVAAWPAGQAAQSQKLEHRASPARGAGRGRPPVHEWEGFWIEVVLYAAKHDLDPEHRRVLQRHMEEWTATQWPEPPDKATIRRRLQRLFDAAQSAWN